MKHIALLLFATLLSAPSLFAADPPKPAEKTSPPTVAKTERPVVHLTDAEKAQLYKTLAAAANAQSAVMQAQTEAKARVDELTSLRSRLEQKCGTSLTEEAGGLADCAPPKKEIAAK